MVEKQGGHCDRLAYAKNAGVGFFDFSPVLPISQTSHIVIAVVLCLASSGSLVNKITTTGTTTLGPPIPSWWRQLWLTIITHLISHSIGQVSAEAI